MSLLNKKSGQSLIEVKISLETQKLYDSFVENVKKRIESGEDRNVICRDVLTQLYYAGDSCEAVMENTDLSIYRRVQVSVYDPRNITLEPEYYHNIDKAKFDRVKPLIWLWMMFDRSSAGRNLHLGLNFRRMLASFIFRRLGDNVKIFHNVEVSFGYNIEVGKGTVIHREVMLDDRGDIIIGENVSISDYAAIYSHSHDIVDIHTVSLSSTVIGSGARIMYHSTVLSGVTIGKEATLGAYALATRDIQDYHIHVGIPAKSVKLKPNALQDNRG